MARILHFENGEQDFLQQSFLGFVTVKHSKQNLQREKTRIWWSVKETGLKLARALAEWNHAGLT